MGHNKNLDILRGFAALIVFIGHFNQLTDKFDPTYGRALSVYYNFPGSLSVLMFFILSGYVIGINTPPLTNSLLIKDYIKKRLVRIVPIYFIAIIFTAMIGHYTWPQIFSNLFFVSVPLGNWMDGNFPLWSLNFELIYYFVFIFFSFYKISLSKTIKGTLITIGLLFAFSHNKPIHPLFISYTVGFLFWITGAFLAQKKDMPYWNISGIRLIAIFVLIFGLQNLNPYGPFMKMIRIPIYEYPASYNFPRIFYFNLYFFPFTLVIILGLTHMYTRFGKYIVYFYFLTMSARVLMLVKVYGWHYIIDDHYVVPVLALIVSMLLWVANFKISPAITKIIKSTAALSSISYAIYIMHAPSILFFGNFPAPNIYLFVLKIIIFLVTFFGACYLLELKLQPVIRNYFRKKKVSESGFVKE